VLRLAERSPAERQRETADARGLDGVVAALSEAFCAPRGATAGSEPALAC
jgi:hypothetical protein